MRKIVLSSVSALLFIAILCGCSKVTYDNTSPKDELLTVTYPESVYAQLRYRVLYNRLNLSDLKKLVKVQCLRKTETGYYAVLKLENQTYAYIVIDRNDQCIAIYRFQEPFQSRDEIEAILTDSVYEPVVSACNLNTMYMKMSAVTVAVYPVQEGFVVAQFWSKPLIAEDRILQKVEFYEDIANSPYATDISICRILDIDRSGI